MSKKVFVLTRSEALRIKQLLARLRSTAPPHQWRKTDEWIAKLGSRHNLVEDKDEWS